MAKKPKTIKIPKEEMDTLNDIRGEYSSIQLRLGEIELKRISLEKSLNELDELRVMTESNYIKNTEREAQFTDSLSKKYGPGNLDLSKGEFTPSK
jgi:hypothetical protein|tara:strand:+ start:158 stop:442 length:285 start_codon:yes stop_codon:yes gene_type:complete